MANKTFFMIDIYIVMSSRLFFICLEQKGWKINTKSKDDMNPVQTEVPLLKIRLVSEPYVDAVKI